MTTSQTTAQLPAELDSYASLTRLMSLMTGDEKHSFAATSTLDVLWVLYDRVLRVTPEDAGAEDRDRFLLSKGHGPMAYYAVLAAKGFISSSLLEGWARYESPLGMHPDRVLVPGVEISSGSLGHGLPLALGMAFALRAKGTPEARVFCLVGDAELDEGSNHEAMAVAARAGLERLHVVAVDNQSASRGWPGGLAARFEIEGWSVATVDGRDHEEIETALSLEHSGRPHAVVARVEAK
jgi:transketolase